MKANKRITKEQRNEIIKDHFIKTSIAFTKGTDKHEAAKKYVPQIVNLLNDGWTNYQISTKLDVNEKLVDAWKNLYNSFKHKHAYK